MMNRLESLLNDIGSFNVETAKLGETATALNEARDDIIARAKGLGITRPNAAAMLTKIVCKVSPPADSGPGEREVG